MDPYASNATALLNEWAQRRDTIFNGSNELLHKLTSLPKTDDSGVFATTDVELNDVQAYGFDLDYTLAHYHTALESFIYDSAVKVLVEQKLYPSFLREGVYDPFFPTRSVIFDPATACLLKLDATRHVDVAFRGRRELKREEVTRLYGPYAHIRFDKLIEMRFLEDIFSYPEIALIADVVEGLTKAQLTFSPAYVQSDVTAAIGEVHRSGALYKEVLSKPEEYIKKDDKLVPMLKRLKEAGKSTFIITNSPWAYCDGILKHLIGEQWLGYFDVVVTQAGKPAFYKDSRRPFRRMIPGSNRVDWQPVDKIIGAPSHYASASAPAVLVNGNLKDFVELTGYSDVLFSGDHIEADMRDPRTYGWRTALIIKELKRDVQVGNSEEFRTLLCQLLEAKDFLSNMYSLRRETHKYVKDATRAKLLDEIDDTKRRIRSLYASKFGSVFSCADMSSLFGLRQYRWADLYTAKVTNLLAHDLDAYLCPRSTMNALPHDVRVVL